MWGSSGDAESVGAEASVARAASNGWYNNELGLFPASDYGKPTPDMSNFHDWGHYSQLVWKSTRQLGCATHFCPPGTMNGMGSWYTVCNYSPAGMCHRAPFALAARLLTSCSGNMGGAYGENVLPPGGMSVFSA